MSTTTPAAPRPPETSRPRKALAFLTGWKFLLVTFVTLVLGSYAVKYVGPWLSGSLKRWCTPREPQFSEHGRRILAALYNEDNWKISGEHGLVCTAPGGDLLTLYDTKTGVAYWKGNPLHLNDDDTNAIRKRVAEVRSKLLTVYEERRSREVVEAMSKLKPRDVAGPVTPVPVVVPASAITVPVYSPSYYYQVLDQRRDAEEVISTLCNGLDREERTRRKRRR